MTSSFSRKSAVVVRPDELKVTGARACGQIGVIIVRAAQSSCSIHICVVGGQIGAGNSHCSIEQESGLSPVTELDCQHENDEGEEEDVSLGFDLSTVETNGEKAWISGFQDLIREPCVLSRVSIHRDHLGDQRACESGFRNHLSH
ncbi:hypothetical protein DNTS_003438 [Danionella cerebrum]|uniref:Uncharacterized protein n=1 Tax=Danionella cerebrum TaxID=2873325 RepID=A0A553P185_9TELE|nr:hypothetical protein DNTS_003438 [Danionella translucida]